MNHETLLKRVDILVLSCHCLAQLIRSFESVLIKENEAIARSDINELEAITQEKIYFGSKVDEGVQDIRKHLSYLGSALGDRLSDHEDIRMSWLIKSLRAAAHQATSAAALDRGIANLETALKVMEEARTAIFPKIEANAYMVKKLLQYHRETYAFWQSIAQESEAVYGKTGKSVTATQKSILSVRT